MNYLEADQTGVSPLTLRPTGNPLHDQLIQGLHAIGQQQQIASQMPQAELELKRSEAIKNRSAAGGYTLDQASSLMSPNGSPEDIAKAKNELASLYPSGVVPKDYAHMGAAAGRSELSLGIRKDQYDQKRLTALGESLDPSKQRAGAFGVSKQVFDRAERLQSLAVASMGNPDRRQMEELAIGLNAMLSGSNTGAQDQVKALVPQSLVGNANKLREWLVNDPTGTGQQEFVKRLNDTIAREKATAMDQIKRTQFQRIGRYADLEQSSPDAFTNALQSNGIEPGEYKAWKSGGYKPMSAVQDKNGKPANDPLGLFK